MSTRTWILALAAAALVMAVPHLLHRVGPGPVLLTGEPASTGSPAPTPAAAPPELIAHATRPPRPRSPADGPRAISRAEAERAFHEALQATTLVVESVREHDAPPPTPRERGRLRRDAVLALVDLAPHLDEGARASQHAAMRAALGRLETLQPHFDDDEQGAPP